MRRPSGDHSALSSKARTAKQPLETRAVRPDREEVHLLADRSLEEQSTVLAGEGGPGGARRPASAAGSATSAIVLRIIVCSFGRGRPSATSRSLTWPSRSTTNVEVIRPAAPRSGPRAAVDLPYRRAEAQRRIGGRGEMPGRQRAEVQESPAPNSIRPSSLKRSGSAKVSCDTSLAAPPPHAASAASSRPGPTTVSFPLRSCGEGQALHARGPCGHRPCRADIRLTAR